ncbi:unnamed protein product [Didymodactylos carnosus]|uniref:NADH dehydrogenase [ubiquinone] 1 subunit C2 n=1 Tax=Didymodactylos carnosus TaxID=1234261 RepID=A0A8S2HHR2_9BILA|nr:unnamed protein product [Didymodactylos carnosus]CAF3644873.1 unnamed protein product [Didymodactylos carnosus]
MGNTNRPLGEENRAGYPFGQKWQWITAYERKNVTFAEEQPPPKYDVLGGGKGDEYRNIEPGPTRGPLPEPSKAEINKNTIALFSPKAQKIILYEMGITESDLDRDYDNDPRYRVWGLPYFIKPYDHRVLIPLSLTLMVGTRNQWLRRPWWSARPLHITAIVGGVIIGHYWKKYRAKQLLQRELIIWDYIRRHPEDFPEVFHRKKKYKEIFQPWSPLR